MNWSDTTNTQIKFYEHHIQLSNKSMMICEMWYVSNVGKKQHKNYNLSRVLLYT